MKSIISRTYQKNETLGTWLVMDGEKLVYKCKCIELPDLGNQHNVSCIPEGAYDVIKENNTERGNYFRVLNVTGRDGILIHKGNYAAGKHVDTEGCILPGAYFTDINNDGYLDVAESGNTMNKLYEILPSKFRLYIL